VEKETPFSVPHTPRDKVELLIHDLSTISQWNKFILLLFLGMNESPILVAVKSRAAKPFHRAQEAGFGSRRIAELLSRFETYH